MPPFLFIKLIRLVFSSLLARVRFALFARLHRLAYHTIPDADAVRNIVVVGASFAGYTAARILAASVPSGYRVVVVEKNSHFQFTWVFPRFSVVKGHDHKAFIPYGPFVADVAPEGAYQWVRGRVEEIMKDDERGGRGFVVVNDDTNTKTKRTIPFDYLVIATGSSADRLPSRTGVDDKNDGIRVFRDMQDRIANATDIVVLGGGPAGVELAADAKDRYPDKTVTLVHSRDKLLNRFGPKIQAAAAKELERLGVQVVLGERVQSDDSESGYVMLKSGKKIPCDCLVKCIGQKPNSSLIANLSPSSISASGYIKVQPTLQLADADEIHGNIYAIGDVIELDDGSSTARNARSATEQAEIAATNIVRCIKGQRQKQIHYRPQWWEGGTKVTMGLTKSIIWLGDGNAEITLSSTRKDVTMDAARLWRMLGVRPYDDDSNDGKQEEIAASV